MEAKDEALALHPLFHRGVHAGLQVAELELGTHSRSLLAPVSLSLYVTAQSECVPPHGSHSVLECFSDFSRLLSCCYGDCGCGYGLLCGLVCELCLSLSIRISLSGYCSLCLSVPRSLCLGMCCVLGFGFGFSCLFFRNSGVDGVGGGILDGGLEARW